jgi:pimeloyl-ACP methyl ester carboxylesterase
VDPDRIATYGVSMGGYIGPRTAAYDKRIGAVVANSILDSLGDLFKETSIFYTEKLKAMDPTIWGVLECTAWRFGLTDPVKMVESNDDFKYDAADVQCPVLILIGEGEYNSSSYVQNVQNRCLEALPNSKKQMTIAPTNEGAAHHCMMENSALAAQVAFDWLDEIFT